MSLTVFTFEEYPIRFVGTAERPEWIAKDVCHCLGILDHSSALATLEDYDKGQVINDTPSGKQKHITVYETGLYALIFKSRKPEAKAFKRWIIEEVLPSIRKTGSYSVGADYNGMTNEELKAELERKKLLLGHLKVDQQLERFNKAKQPNNDEPEAELIDDVNLAKIYKLLCNKGSITAQDVKRNIRSFATANINFVQTAMLQLVALGKARVVPTKKGLRIKV